MKVIEKIRENDGKVVFSLEFMPPRSKNGIEEVVKKIERAAAQNPAFCDITWRAGAGNEEISLDIANKMQNMLHVETMMHLTCINTPIERIDHALSTIKSNGVQNVLALRGDPPSAGAVQLEDGFTCALDLVKYIRAKYGDYFGITVAGYPEAHQDVIGSDGVATPEAYQKDLAYLKQKVDAGADVIVTQLFFDIDIFLKFVKDCRDIGITCPIIPGIFLVSKYTSFVRMTKLCKTKIPNEIIAALKPIKDNPAAVLNYGIHLGTEMCKKLLANGIKTLHLYTINNEKSALAILTNLGLIGAAPVARPISEFGENHSENSANLANGAHKAPTKCEEYASSVRIRMVHVDEQAL